MGRALHPRPPSRPRARRDRARRLRRDGPLTAHAGARHAPPLRRPRPSGPPRRVRRTSPPRRPPLRSSAAGRRRCSAATCARPPATSRCPACSSTARTAPAGRSSSTSSTVQDALAANASLSCGAQLITTDLRGPYVNALFRLTDRTRRRRRLRLRARPDRAHELRHLRRPHRPVAAGAPGPRVTAAAAAAPRRPAAAV